MESEREREREREREGKGRKDADIQKRQKDRQTYRQIHTRAANKSEANRLVVTEECQE